MSMHSVIICVNSGWLQAWIAIHLSCADLEVALAPRYEALMSHTINHTCTTNLRWPMCVLSKAMQLAKCSSCTMCPYCSLECKRVSTAGLSCPALSSTPSTPACKERNHKVCTNWPINFSPHNCYWHSYPLTPPWLTSPPSPHLSPLWCPNPPSGLL